jgi:hypothetical protein
MSVEDRPGGGSVPAAMAGAKTPLKLVLLAQVNQVRPVADNIREPVPVFNGSEILVIPVLPALFRAARHG